MLLFATVLSGAKIASLGHFAGPIPSLIYPYSLFSALLLCFFATNVLKVTDEMEVTRALDLARVEFGSCPSVAVNCAGIGYAKRTISRYVPCRRRFLFGYRFYCSASEHVLANSR